MSHLIIDDSYWFVDETDPENAKISALCEICHLKENKGWHWQGKQLGYGDYDLYCSVCNKAIYLRDKNDKENKTPN